MVPGDAHVDAKKQGKAFLYVPRQVRRRYQKMTSQTLGRSIFIQDWIRTGVVVNRASVEPESHTLRERDEREASNPIDAFLANGRLRIQSPPSMWKNGIARL